MFPADTCVESSLSLSLSHVIEIEFGKREIVIQRRLSFVHFPRGIRCTAESIVAIALMRVEIDQTNAVVTDP